MRTFLIAFALAFFAGIVLTWLIRNLALRWGLYDEPAGGRHIHQQPIPRLGGIAVALSFSIPIIGLALWSNDISSALFAERGLLISSEASSLFTAIVTISMASTPFLMKFTSSIRRPPAAMA